MVDDAEWHNILLRKMLRESGYRVVTFTSGQALLRQLRRVTPHLIISDINMPGMDGFELCRQIKRRPEACDIPLIYVSSLARDFVLPRMERHGATGFMQKPLAKEPFLHTIAQQF